MLANSKMVTIINKFRNLMKKLSIWRNFWKINLKVPTLITHVPICSRRKLACIDIYIFMSFINILILENQIISKHIHR